MAGIDRDRVLTAARAEFTLRGFRAVTADDIAERAGLPPDAVHAAFPSLRALYFTVLAQVAAEAPEPPYPPTARSASSALSDVARSWVGRLPLALDGQRGEGRLGRDLIPEIAADEMTRVAYAGLMNLSAIVLGLGLEQWSSRRMVRVAEAALTTLHGASITAAAAPGFGEPFDLVTACGALAELDLGDKWDPPHLDFVPAAQQTDEPWSPPPMRDALRDEPARLTTDGVVAVLGLHRLHTLEEAVRGARLDDEVTIALVTSTPAELSPLAHLVVTEIRNDLRTAFPAATRPRVQLIHDDHAVLAAAAGRPTTTDTTEFAVRIENGRIAARADGHGACHAAAVSRTGGADGG